MQPRAPAPELLTRLARPCAPNEADVASAPSQQQAREPPQFLLGTDVIAHGLVAAAALNGLRGTVVITREGNAGERVGVDFGAPHGRKAIRPANLRVAGDVEEQMGTSSDDFKSCVASPHAMSPQAPAAAVPRSPSPPPTLKVSPTSLRPSPPASLPSPPPIITPTDDHGKHVGEEAQQDVNVLQFFYFATPNELGGARE
eukprot:gene2862-biopygen30489